MLFSGKANYINQVLQASEKNVGVSTSSQQYQDDDSDSSSDGDLFLEVQNEDEQILNIDSDFKQAIQAACVVNLFINSKNPDELDDVPSIEHISEIKPITQKVFRRKT